jgi:hypothetical protein
LPNEINYYRVGLTAGENINYSLPFLFHNIDSIPPSKPSLSKYFVKDSLLHLSWNANPESDLAGYRVYKSQKPNAEPSLIYDENKLDTVVIFTENLSFINNQRYYYLVAFDQNGNASELSDRFKVELPDIVPPSPPQIRGITQKEDSLKINFISSSSNDVETYLLYRKIDDSLYKLIDQLDSGIQGSIDIVEKGGNYKYRLVALDKAGNEGVSKAYPFKVLFKSKGEIEYKIILNENSFKIMWDIPHNQATKVKVYYKSNEHYNFIREANANDKTLEMDKRNRQKENFKLIFI